VKLFVDLDTLALIDGPGFRNPAPPLRFKRGDAALLEVVFLAGGSTPVTIGDAELLQIQFGVKILNGYDTGYLVQSSQWTKPADGSPDPVYRATPSFNTAELNAALHLGGVGGAELASIVLMGEITWRQGTGEPTSTRTFAVIVENDVNRGDEGTPLVLPTPEDWLTERALRHDLTQTLTNAGKYRAQRNLRAAGNLQKSVSIAALGFPFEFAQLRPWQGSLIRVRIDGFTQVNEDYPISFMIFSYQPLVASPPVNVSRALVGAEYLAPGAPGIADNTVVGTLEGQPIEFEFYAAASSDAETSLELIATSEHSSASRLSYTATLLL
jgi:hypothetical protein